MSDLPPATAEAVRRLTWVVDSFHRLTGGRLVAANDRDNDNDNDLWTSCWTAPRVIVAHGSEPDPIFFYGNQLALQRFQLDFAAFTRLPSRCSAEPLHRDARAALLARVRERGFIADYAGVRISASGERFRIERAVVWEVFDEAGQRRGQAATFDQWQILHE